MGSIKPHQSAPLKVLMGLSEHNPRGRREGPTLAVGKLSSNMRKRDERRDKRMQVGVENDRVHV